jgi:hypothetical protein
MRKENSSLVGKYQPAGSRNEDSVVRGIGTRVVTHPPAKNAGRVGHPRKIKPCEVSLLRKSVFNLGPRTYEKNNAFAEF